jgi:adenylate cyclase
MRRWWLTFRGSAGARETMYDVPSHLERRQRVSLTAVQNVFDTENRLLTNINESKALALTILTPFDEDQANAFRSEQYGVENALKYLERLKEVSAFLGQFIEGLEQVSPEDRSAQDEALLSNFRLLKRNTQAYDREFVPLVNQLADFRADLRRQLGGKIVLVGMTGTGTMDFYPTAIHSVAPGVVAHGALVNGLLTGELWTRAPIWVTYVLTLVVGIITTLIVEFVSPWKATVGALGAMASYVFINGLVLFDTYDIIVGVAGPMTAIGGVWAGVTLLRFIFEIRERNRITARFRSYVDPELVNYVAAHPDQASFSGREQIMTVVFTDLEGFTTLSERLGKDIVGTLNDYVGAMTPIIRGNRGFIDKFLGDGIMFEFNAVIPNKQHAIDAINAVLQMQEAMVPFNAGLTERKLPNLKMRVGVNTGPMIFGDAGGAGANNITVLGDAVNLAARLEGANKPFGSAIMMTQDTLDQCEGRFTVRPIANIRVKGKEKAVVVYEPLCLAGEETPEIVKLIKLTQKVFDLYTAAKFEECMKACDEMNAELGGHVKFADTYHRACVTLLAEGAGPDFDGSISLSEK